MCAGVAVDVQSLLLFQGDDLQRVPLGERMGQIDERAVYPRADSAAEQPLPDRPRRVRGGCVFRDSQPAAVFQYNFHNSLRMKKSPSDCSKDEYKSVVPP